MSGAWFCPILFTCGVSGFPDTKLLLSVECPPFLFSCTQNAQRQREGQQDGKEKALGPFMWRKRLHRDGDFHSPFEGTPGSACVLAFVNERVGFQVRQSSLASEGDQWWCLWRRILRVMRRGNWVVGWARESRKGDHGVSYPHKTVCSTAKHRMFFSSKTCLSAGQLFITSTDMQLGTSCCWKKSAIRSPVLFGLWLHEFASICLFLSTELAILHGSSYGKSNPW